jgi:hypothetical protein
MVICGIQATTFAKKFRFKLTSSCGKFYERIFRLTHASYPTAKEIIVNYGTLTATIRK